MTSEQRGGSSRGRPFFALQPATAAAKTETNSDRILPLTDWFSGFTLL